jgi:hypothetical protein
VTANNYILSDPELSVINVFDADINGSSPPNLANYPTRATNTNCNLPLTGYIGSVVNNGNQPSWINSAVTVKQVTITLLQTPGGAPQNALKTLPAAADYANIGNGNGGSPGSGTFISNNLRTLIASGGQGIVASTPPAFPATPAWGTDNTAAFNYALALKCPGAARAAVAIRHPRPGKYDPGRRPCDPRPRFGQHQLRDAWPVRVG